MLITADNVIAVARKELGTKEYPDNSNKTKYGKWFGLDGNPWCMMFVQWVFNQAGGADLLPKKTASCSDLMNAAKSKKCWITTGYAPGDVVIYDFPNTGVSTDHCGIIASVGKDYIEAIEGNTSAKNNSNGGEVMQRVRSTGLILGAVRPAYSNDVDKLIEGMTSKQLMRLLERIQWALSKQSVSGKLKDTWNEAREKGITDGSDPQALCTRAQTAAMVLRGGGKNGE